MLHQGLLIRQAGGGESGGRGTRALVELELSTFEAGLHCCPLLPPNLSESMKPQSHSLLVIDNPPHVKHGQVLGWGGDREDTSLPTVLKPGCTLHHWSFQNTPRPEPHFTALNSESQDGIWAIAVCKKLF